MKKLLLYGLQRSGTNFVEQLIARNFNVTFLNSNEHRDAPIQKHFRLYDDKSVITPPAYGNDYQFRNFEEFEAVLPEPADGYVVISKDPYSWTLSYQKWAKKCNWPNARFHPAAEWEAFYAKWVDFSRQTDRITFVRYADLLERSDNVLIRLKRNLGLELKDGRTEFTGALDRVPQSGAFTDDKRLYYTERRYLAELSEQEISAINDEVTDSTLAEVDYERVRAEAGSSQSA